MQELLQRAIDDIRGAWRYRWTAIASAWAICLLGWLVVLVVPNSFEATARVFVDPSTALKPVIQGLAVEQDVDAEINLVRQSLLSERSLDNIVTILGFDAKSKGVEQRPAMIRQLRDRIVIDVQGSGGDRSQASKVYTIRYKDSERERSLAVVQRLLDDFVSGTKGGKLEGSQQAQEFLRDQIKEYDERLTAAEQRLADFKRSHIGMMPGEQAGADYFARLQSEMDLVKQSENGYSALLLKRDTLQKQLRGEAPVAASAGIQGTNAGGAGGAVNDTLSRVRDTQARIDDLLLRYTDKHPDVIALREALVALQQRREAELTALRNGDATAAASTGASANPIYQSIQLALNQVDVDIVASRAELAAHRDKVAEYRRMLNTMPEVEAEYAKLNRDYTVTKAQFTALSERLEKARVGGDADASGSVRFEIVDPPTVGYRPVSPPRTLLLIGTLFLALVVGVTLAYGLNLLKPVYFSRESLAAATGIPVVGVVSLYSTPQQVAGHRTDVVRLVLASAGMVLALVAVGLVSSYYAPLRLPL